MIKVIQNDPGMFKPLPMSEAGEVSNLADKMPGCNFTIRTGHIDPDCGCFVPDAESQVIDWPEDGSDEKE